MFFTRLQTPTHVTPTLSKSPSQPRQHPQTRSSFLHRLPPELRNEIYSLVFTVSTSPAPATVPSHQPPHPLALLQTCRRIYNEASLLAFTTYTFPVRAGLQPTHLGLQAAIAHLPATHVAAIRSLSVPSSADPASLLSNALVLLPRLSAFAVDSPPHPRAQSCGHGLAPRLRSSRPGHSFTAYSEDTELALRAVDHYAPPWLVHVVESVAAGRAVQWQSGARWTARWPQLESELCYARVQCDAGGLREEWWMDGDAVGAVAGVEICGGRCGEVLWTRAVLVQEGGRCVGVEAVGGRGADPEVVKPTCAPKVLLVPGAEPADDLVFARAGIGYDADAEYWEAMRRRNGDFGALCRGLWKTAAGWHNAAVVSNDGAIQSSLKPCS
ncbi:hypothetical protein SVAN01_03353 [Stagonosporopsis vannaccii]|nr:hypothetical protein SVAN01_03353 [Stagonosporopsis vannaccii]